MNYMACNKEKLVPQYRQIVDEVTQAPDESIKKQIIAERLERVLKESNLYMKNVPVSGATVSRGGLPTAGDETLITYLKQCEKAAITTAVMIGDPKGIGASELQKMITARLLGDKVVRKLGHSVEENWTDFSGKLVAKGHTVQSLAEEWDARFRAEEKDVRDLVWKAHRLIAKNYGYLEPKLFSCSHVEHMMCEARKFLESTQAKRGAAPRCHQP